jgi:hypothetical protein
MTVGIEEHQKGLQLELLLASRLATHVGRLRFDRLVTPANSYTCDFHWAELNLKLVT